MLDCSLEPSKQTSDKGKWILQIVSYTHEFGHVIYTWIPYRLGLTVWISLQHNTNWLWDINLTHWGGDKKVAIFDTTFSNRFFLIKTMYFDWNFIVGPFGLFNQSIKNYVLVGAPATPWLTHWGRVAHKCVSKVTIIVWDNGLSPGRRQAIIWTNAGYCQLDPWEQTSLEF